MNPDPQPTNSQVEVQAVTVREESQAVERAKLNLDELHENLAFIRQVMAREMKEGQDYGKIPGCGDKPGLFQPGAQKLLMTFKLTPHVKKEVLRELPHPSIFGHREYEFTISVRSNTGREWDGVGTCSTFESKYRYRSSQLKCPDCGKTTIFKSKKPGEGWYCWAKKGGCGAQFKPDAPGITSQDVGKVENENPAEFWNTVRKMAFKRAIVHASINATNTSELWSQDLEDLPQASMRAEYLPDDNVSFDDAPPPQQSTPAPKTSPAPATSAAKPVMDEKVLARYRMKALNNLQAAPGGPNRELVRHFCMAQGWLTGTQELEQLPAAHVPTTPEQMASLFERVSEFEGRSRQDHSDAVRENMTK